MLTKKIIEVESRVLGLQVVHNPKTGYFHDKTKILKGKSSSKMMLQKAMYLDSPDQAKSKTLTPKWKILNVFWTWLEVNEGFVQ